MAVQTNPYANCYHIGNSDNPGTMLVSHLLTGKKLYSSWRRSMTIALNANNKFGFIDGSIAIPKEDDQMYQSWFQNNNVVSSWLLNSISKDLIANITYSSTAVEMWKILQDQFHQPNSPRICQLQRDLVSYTQGNLSVNGYFSKIQALWKEVQEI